jgi:hypothetical protein
MTEGGDGSGQRPRLEARIAGQPPPPRTRPRNGWIALLAFFAIGAWLHPLSIGALVVLPLVLSWLGFRAVGRHPVAPGMTIRFLDDVLEVEGASYVARTRWEHVERAHRSDAGLVVAMPGGEPLTVPADQLPADPAALRALLPAHVRLEDPPAPPAPAASTRTKTFALWLVLVLLATLVYSLLGDR